MEARSAQRRGPPDGSAARAGPAGTAAPWHCRLWRTKDTRAWRLRHVAVTADLSKAHALLPQGLTLSDHCVLDLSGSWLTRAHYDALSLVMVGCSEPLPGVRPGIPTTCRVGVQVMAAMAETAALTGIPSSRLVSTSGGNVFATSLTKQLSNEESLAQQAPVSAS